MYIDSHRHFTVGNSSIDELLKELDSDNFDKTVLFGYNGLELEGQHGQDKKVLEVYYNAKDRIIPFLCDFNFNDCNVEKYVISSLENGIFRGVGEILIGHTIINDFHFKNVKYSDKEVTRLFKIISEFKVPVLAHADKAFEEDFLNAVHKCGKTNFIWAHNAYDFGSIFGGEESVPKHIEQILMDNENLFFDISMWKISPIYLADEEWLKLLEKYSSRFLFGTDMTDNYLVQSVWIRAYEKVFERLSHNAKQNITRNNIIKLCFGKIV